MEQSKNFHMHLKNKTQNHSFNFRCRRKLISKHFQEVWDSVDCKNMCDRCYYKDKFTPSAKEISNYCNELYLIIDKADGMDVKLTGLKLIDAWFVKQ